MDVSGIYDQLGRPRLPFNACSRKVQPTHKWDIWSSVPVFRADKKRHTTPQKLKHQRSLLWIRFIPWLEYSSVITNGYYQHLSTIIDRVYIAKWVLNHGSFWIPQARVPKPSLGPSHSAASFADPLCWTPDPELPWIQRRQHQSCTLWLWLT